MKTIRILNYAVNGLGLGHITRLIAINRWIRRISLALGIRPEIFFLTSSECDTIAYQNNFSAFKIPSKNSIRDSGINQIEYRKIAKQWVWNSINLINPHILIVDTFPYGSFNELFDIMDFGFKKIFIYRAIKPQIAENNNFQKALIGYDKIIIPIEFPLEDYKFPETISERVYRTKEIMIRDIDELYDRNESRNILGINKNNLACYVSLGGGGDENAETFFENIISIIKNISDVEFIIGAGPLYKGREFRANNVHWFYRYNALEYFNAFDFAISSGGYNNVHELLYTNIPSILYPLSRFYDDQERRINTLEKENICIKLNSFEQDEIINKINLLKDNEFRKKIKFNLLNRSRKNFAFDAAKIILSDFINTDDLDHIENQIPGSYFLSLRKENIPEIIGLNAINILDNNYSEYKKLRASLKSCSEYFGFDENVKNYFTELNKKIYYDFIEYPLHSLSLGFLKFVKNKGIELNLSLKYLKIFIQNNFNAQKNIQEVLLEATNYINLLSNKNQNINDSISEYIFENELKVNGADNEV